MDFGALPPELNSGLMYSGAGSGPLLAAAAAWGSVAAELGSVTSSYDSVISGLSGESWSGPTAAAMTAAVTPFLSWLGGTAAQAEQTAAQVRAAAVAYDVAFTATVPPPVVAANRSLLTALIATNILGQNTAAIAATEAHYGEMWAQDAAAMYSYAGAAASVVRLTPFSAPPATANSAGQVMGANAAAAAGAQAQTALAQLIALVPPALQGLAASGPSTVQATSPILAILDFLAGPTSPISLFGIGGIPYLLAIQLVLLPMNGSNVVASVVRAQGPKPWIKEPVPDPAELAAGLRLASAPGPVGMPSAGVGNAGSVGRLSVPQGWTSELPTARTAAAVVPGPGPGVAAAAVAADGQGGLLSELAMGGLAGRAVGAGGGAASRAVGGVTGSVAASKPSKATIIVIPPSAED